MTRKNNLGFSMLVHGIPSPKAHKEGLSDPLGISFDGIKDNDQFKLDLDGLKLDDEIAWMRARVNTHPLIGTVVTNNVQPSTGQTDTVSNTGPRASTGRRRSSVGGDRASAIVAQFEVADVDVDPIQPITDEEMEEGYPESEHEGSGSYFDEVTQSDDVSLDLPTVRR